MDGIVKFVDTILPFISFILFVGLMVAIEFAIVRIKDLIIKKGRMVK